MKLYMYIDRNGKKWFKGNLHTHSTKSDGKLSPDEVLSLYRNTGYDFLAFTDHWKPSETMQANGILLLSGCEYDVGIPHKEVYHIVSIGAKEPARLEKSPSLTAQQVIDAIHAVEGFAILAHPAWSLNEPARIAALRDIDATEIYNSVSNIPWNTRRADSSVIVDTVAVLGRILPLIASDDCHYYNGDECSSFIYLQADVLDYPTVMNSLHKGWFYASQGPQVAWTWVNGTIHISCTPVQTIIFTSNLMYGLQRVVQGEPLTEASYSLHTNEKYVRVELIDREGKYAWTSFFK